MEDLSRNRNRGLQPGPLVVALGCVSTRLSLNRGARTPGRAPPVTLARGNSIARRPRYGSILLRPGAPRPAILPIRSQRALSGRRQHPLPNGAVSLGRASPEAEGPGDWYGRGGGARSWRRTDLAPYQWNGWSRLGGGGRLFTRRRAQRTVHRALAVRPRYTGHKVGGAKIFGRASGRGDHNSGGS